MAKRSQLRRPPPELGRWLEIINFVPVDVELVDPGRTWSDAVAEGADLPSAFTQMLDERYPQGDSRFKNFREFIGPVTASTFSEAGKRYVGVLHMRELLYQIATKGEAEIDLRLTLFANGSYRIDVGHVARFLDLVGVLRTLAGLDLSRVRECRRCHQLYWAGHKRKQGCDDCRHALRQERYRNKWKDQYKQQRYQRAEAQEKVKATKFRKGE